MCLCFLISKPNFQISGPYAPFIFFLFILTATNQPKAFNPNKQTQADVSASPGMVHHNRINLGFEDMENAVECGREI